MDRFEYADARMGPGESYILREKGTKLYDGDSGTSFESGELVLTSHRILWGRPGDIPRGQTCLSLSLGYIILAEEEAAGFGFNRSKKVALHLTEPLSNKMPGPIGKSRYNLIKISFKEGMDNDFVDAVVAAIVSRKWEILTPTSSSEASSSKNPPPIKQRTGILGIERGIQEKQKATDESISMAFQDLSKLMNMAKEMVNLSKNISDKIKDKQGDITEDETVRFKSYLLSLGIDDPVTRGDFSSDNKYYRGLSNQLSEMLLQPVTEAGGMMSLADVYCRVNRARGLELLSPEDLLKACRLFTQPLRLREFESKVIVVQLTSQDDAFIVGSTEEELQARGSITAAEMAQSLGISLLLATERLRTTEKFGKACRDDSIQGLRFYPNLLLEKL